MAKCPLKHIETIFTNVTERAKHNDTVMACTKHGRIEFDKRNGLDEINLYHYGTLIFRYNFNDHSFAMGGYSATDRDWINSMFYLLGLSQKASIAGGHLHADYYGGLDPWRDY